MIQSFRTDGGRLHPAEPSPDHDGLVWIDLRDPTPEEAATAAAWLGVALPSRAEMEEIELSSRLYHQDGADYVTVLVPAKVGEGHRDAVPVAFILRDGRLVTQRHHDPRPFTTYPERAGRMAFGCDRGDAVLLGLFEEIIDRIADILELTAGELDGESRRLFRADADDRPRSSDLLKLLETIGRNGDLVTDLRTCLLSLERAVSYLGPALARRAAPADLRDALEVQRQDVRSLGEHAGFLSQKTNLLLDATLGVVNIDQNANIKLFSVIAVVFLPPTLIASLYGMNFEVMPELSWPWGYPLALLAMVVSAVVPLTWFRAKGWL